tara:strand:- start:5566 stop:5844 length:279 start_codon:yes stop_codon:yes gene_type:complete
MILLKITEEEKPVILEALHFFGRELEDMIRQGPDEKTPEEISKLEIIDQIIDVIQLTKEGEEGSSLFLKNTQRLLEAIVQGDEDFFEKDLTS